MKHTGKFLKEALYEFSVRTQMLFILNKNLASILMVIHITCCVCLAFSILLQL